jgi:hypothetical protein
LPQRVVVGKDRFASPRPHVTVEVGQANAPPAVLVNAPWRADEFVEVAAHERDEPGTQRQGAARSSTAAFERCLRVSAPVKNWLATAEYEPT